MTVMPSLGFLRNNQVGELDHAELGWRLASLQSGLKCGTNCGSCVPELRALVEKVPAGSSRMVA